MIRLHVIANALLLWLGYYWLGVGESSIPRLLWSVVLAALILSAALVVHGAAYAGRSVPPVPAVKETARNILPLLVLALAAIFIYGLLAWWKDYSGGPAFKLASWLTLKTRKPVKPDTVLGVFNFFLWIVRWVLLPCLLAPLASAFARSGWKGFTMGVWKRPRWYWIAVPALLALALWLPLRLLSWVPQVSAFWLQMASFILRLAIGYVLFVGGLLALAWVTARPANSSAVTATD